MPPNPDPASPYLVPPAHQPGLGAGLAEEVDQRHDGSLALGWHTGKVGLAQSLGQWFLGTRGNEGEQLGGGNKVQGEPRRGLGQPSRTGGPLPLRAPSSSPGYILCRALVLMSSSAAEARGSGGPVPMGTSRVSALGSKLLRRLGLLVCTVLCAR